MTISIECENCGRQYNVRDDLAGKTIKCKECAEPILIESDDIESDDEEFAPPPSRQPRRRPAADRPPRSRSSRRPSGSKNRGRKRTSGGGMPKWVPWTIGGVVAAIGIVVVILLIGNLNSPAALMRRGIALQREATEILASVQDNASAEAAAEKLKALQPRIEALKNDAKEMQASERERLKDMSLDEKRKYNDEMEEKHKDLIDDVREAAKAMGKERFRISRNPEWRRIIGDSGNIGF